MSTSASSFLGRSSSNNSNMRGLVQFIADLRNARARELEEKRINKELANIRYGPPPRRTRGAPSERENTTENTTRLPLLTTEPLSTGKNSRVRQSPARPSVLSLSD